MVAIDEKAAERCGGEMLLNAVTVPSLYLGSDPVPVDKTNDIFGGSKDVRALDLVGRLVGSDALHTHMETAECSDVWLSALCRMVFPR